MTISIIKHKYIVSLLLLFILFTFGCSVPPPPPTHYYLLDNPAPPQKTDLQAPKHPVAINPAEIVLIPPYNGENLLVKLNGGEIQFYNYEKWGAPPAKMIQNYLNKTFLYQNLFNISERRGRNKNSYQLKLEFQEFAHNREHEKNTGSIIVFAGIMKNAASGYDWYKLYTIQTPTKSNQVPDIVKALNAGIEQLARSLLQDIDRYLLEQNNN